jgi:putative transposase
LAGGSDSSCRLGQFPTADDKATFYNWKAKYGGLEVSEAKRLRGLETENTKLKKLLAEAMLDNAALKDLLAKKS